MPGLSAVASAFRSSTAKTIYITVKSSVLRHPRFPFDGLKSRGRERIRVYILSGDGEVYDPDSNRVVARLALKDDLKELLGAGGLLIVKASVLGAAEEILRSHGGSMHVEDLDRELKRLGFAEGVLPALTGHPRIRFEKETGKVHLD